MGFHQIKIKRSKFKGAQLNFQEIDDSVFQLTAKRIIRMLKEICSLKEARFKKGFVPIFAKVGLEQFIASLLVDIEDLGETIYETLLKKRYDTEEFSDLYQKEYLHQEADYLVLLKLLESKIRSKLLPIPKVSQKRSWFRVIFSPTAERKTFGLFRITYKEYFTLFLNPLSTIHLDDKLMEKGLPSLSKIRLFLFQIILPLTKELHKLNQETQGGIELKFRDSLKGLIMHPDSIVIHYSKKEIGPKIRAIVKIIDDHEKTFILERGIKERSGFDLRRVSGEGYQGGSHGQILARLISAEIIINPPSKWDDKDNIVQWLKTTLENVAPLQDTKALALIELEKERLRKSILKRNYPLWIT